MFWTKELVNRDWLPQMFFVEMQVVIFTWWLYEMEIIEDSFTFNLKLQKEIVYNIVP